MDTKPNTSQPCASAVKKVIHKLCCISKSTANISKKMVILLDVECCVQFWAPLYKTDRHTRKSTVKITKVVRLEHMAYTEELWELGVLSLTNRGLTENLTVVSIYLTEQQKEDSQILLRGMHWRTRETIVSCSKGNVFHHEGGKVLEWVAQRRCRMFNLENILSCEEHNGTITWYFFSLNFSRI